MKQLNAKSFGLASGIASVIVYLGCALVMIVLGKEGLVKLSNLLFHGMEFSEIIRPDIPLTETLLGAIFSFIFWGVTGFFLALIYNKTSA